MENIYHRLEAIWEIIKSLAILSFPFTTITIIFPLLLASNSVFYIDSDNTMVVNSRNALDTKTTFYGQDEPFGRENIFSLQNIKEGFNRIFNSIILNDTLFDDATSIADFGLSQKTISLSFITTLSTETTIANSMLTEFKDPKKELQTRVSTKNARDLALLNEVELDIINNTYNDIGITTDDRFKILSIIENTSNFTTNILLREI